MLPRASRPGGLRDELGIPAEDCDITGYWKRGVADFDDEPEHEHEH